MNDVLQYKYHFNASGNLGYHEDMVNGVDYRYEYDLAERLVSVVANNGYAISYNYDVNNNISKVTEEINNKQFVTDYLYDKDNRLKDVTYTRDGVQNKVSNNYDTIGRLDTRTVTYNTTPINTTSYTFEAGGQGTNSTTSLVKTMTTNGHTYTFMFDDVGNITEIKDNDGSTTKTINYDYNELNELVREDNEVVNKTIVYDYDLGGNILSKTEYPYTLGDLAGVTGTKIDYTYGNANWKDQLTKYDGKTIDYDAIGNPISYDGYTYTWEAGDQLAGISSTEVTTSYKYNDGGYRTEKTVNGVTTNYYLEGSHVTYETTGDDEIYYTYDSKLISMNLNGEEYFYVYNLQGDVVGLLDSTGTEIVSYTYDTWGQVISITGTKASTVGEKNPYRYRGYRYDSETGLYYLNARYYNPEWGRMLNADSFGGFTGELLSHNVYAYVLNNPVMLFDPTGYYAMGITPEVFGAGAPTTDGINTESVLYTIDVYLSFMPGSGLVAKGTSKAIGFVSKLFGKGAGKVLNSFDDVANYVRKNGKLPDNYITKKEARILGWNPREGNLADVAPGKSIGGDIFKNKENLLPSSSGRVWYEADINYTSGFRGGERLLYSNDGLIYKTTDHYQTFTRIK
ncbi:RHS repeat-associated core domain-containing protein [Lottiidibacillus patelloidae]|uniref:RHS repeat-associated core domain-containing protein n=1 Tax=Lottiidibacillus patelloidae TaxID=2670334 RepID=UPI0013036CE4|nr:ribonuclease domain-containing protein [Lottiidibacillus patelloidae]